MKKAIHASCEDIASFWEDKLKQFNDLEGAPLHKVCWRCGTETKRIQRCHVIPDALGGAETPSNLVLLCPACHAEAPDVNDPSYMWEWIEKTRRKLLFDTPGTYWVRRAIDEYKYIHDKDVTDEFYSSLKIALIRAFFEEGSFNGAFEALNDPAFEVNLKKYLEEYTVSNSLDTSHHWGNSFDSQLSNKAYMLGKVAPALKEILVKAFKKDKCSNNFHPDIRLSERYLEI